MYFSPKLFILTADTAVAMITFLWPTLIAMTSPIRPLSPPNVIVYASASLAREEMSAERKFLQSFLVEAMELQARRKVALESQLHQQPKDSEDDDDEKVRAKHLRRELAVPKNLAQVAAAERQIQSLSNDLMAGDDVGNIRSCVTPRTRTLASLPLTPLVDQKPRPCCDRSSRSSALANS